MTLYNIPSERYHIYSATYSNLLQTRILSGRVFNLLDYIEHAWHIFVRLQRLPCICKRQKRAHTFTHSLVPHRSSAYHVHVINITLDIRMACDPPPHGAKRECSIDNVLICGIFPGSGLPICACSELMLFRVLWFSKC